MKKYILGIIYSIIGTVVLSSSNTVLAEEKVLVNTGLSSVFENDCSKTGHYYLREKKQRNFIDGYRNTSADTTIISGFVNFGTSNRNGSTPIFSWTDKLIENNKKVKQSNDYFEAITSNNVYIKKPEKRDPENIKIQYNIQYQLTKGSSNPAWDKECYSYEITRCGDGIIDSEYGEKCDPNDPNKEGWGNGGCDKETCTPVNVNPVCNSQYNGQNVRDKDLAQEPETDLCQIGGLNNLQKTSTGWTWYCVVSYPDKGTNKPVYTYDTCSAIRTYCGDGIKQDDEECDYNDTKKENWGTIGCSSYCTKLDENNDCITSYKKLYKNPSGKRWTLSFGVTPIENSYRKEFIYTPTGTYVQAKGNISLETTKKVEKTQLLNAGQFTNLLRKKLDVSDIDQYQIKRAYNNIVLTGYFMLTKDQEHTQNVQKVNLCSYYEIKRCGDGILDSEDGEECDPKADGEIEGVTCTNKCERIHAPTYTINKETEKTYYKDGEWYVDWKIKVIGENATSATISELYPGGHSYHAVQGATTSDNGKTFTVALTNGEATFTVTTVSNLLHSINNRNTACVGSTCDGDKHGYLTISKTSNKQELKNLNEEIVWTVTATAHEKPVTDFVITDTLPSDLEFTKIEGTSFNLTKNENNQLTIQYNGTLNAGSSASVKIYSTLKNFSSSKEIKNLACIESTTDGNGNPVCGSSTVTVEPDLSVSLNKKMKSATRDGSKWTVIWTITGTSKNQTSDTIALVDTLPEGYSYVRNNANYNYNNGTFTVPANKDFNFEITTTTSSLKDEKENKICFEKICDTEKTPKIAIEKTPETTDISKMGQEVKWKITVKTLNAQPITNFQITDTLPEGLAFKSITSDKFSASQISTKEENKSLIVSVNGTLNGNSTATFTLTTTVTKAEASYKNTACLEGSELCDDGEITTKFAPKLNIQKYFVLDANGSNQSKKHTAVKKDETVYYKIEFKNEGEKDATVKVEDIFPANLTNTGIDTFVLDGETKDKSELSSFTLKEKGNGYIITHGTTTSENRSSTTNTGRITKLDDNGNTPSNCQKNDCYFEDTVTYTVDMHPKLWIEKGILKEGNFYTGMQTSLEYKGGDEIEFRVNFGNSGDIEIENLRFEDVLENLEFLDRKVTYEEHLYIDGTEINKSDPFTLEDGKTGQYILKGKIRKQEYRSETSNQACLKHETENICIKDKKIGQYCPKGDKEICSNVFFQPKFPALKITKEFKPDQPVTIGSTGTYIINVTNDGTKDLTGIIVTDDLPTGIKFISTVPTDGFPERIKNETEEKSEKTITFTKSKESALLKNTNFSGTESLDNLHITSTENVDIKKITLLSNGDQNNITSVKLADKEGKKSDGSNNTRVFDFQETQTNGVSCPKTFKNNDELPLRVTISGPESEDQEISFTIYEIETNGDTITKGTESSKKIKFIEEKALLSGGTAEVSIATENVVVDQLSFLLADPLKNTKIFFSKNGTLPLENIYHVYLNGSELTNNNGNFELELGDVTSNSKFDIKVQLTGIIEADKTLGFTINNLTGDRTIAYDTKTTTITFKKAENDNERIKFKEAGTSENWDLEPGNKTIDTIETNFLWDITFPSFTLTKGGTLDSSKIKEIRLNNTLGTCNGESCTFENISIKRGQNSLPLTIDFNDGINSGDTLQFTISENKVEKRNIDRPAEKNVSKHITFIEIPEYVNFETGSAEVKTDTTKISFELPFQINKPLKVTDIVLAVTGTMNSGNIKKIDIDGVILNQAYPEYKGNPNKQDAQPGTKWTINVELKGSAQSGDTFGLILKDFTEKRHIATGSESKTIYFVEDPESVTFTDKGAEALSIYTKEITIDNLKFHLNKELPLTKITLENIGTLPSTGIKEVYINGEKATASENSFTVEKSFTVKNDDSIPVKVTFNTPIQSGTTIQFKLTGLADGRHIELGTVSKILTFIDNPALEQKITIGGTLANDILAQNEVIQDTFKVYFNNVPTDQSITLKKITFQKTGTMNTDQTSFSLSKGSEIYGNNTKLTNGKMSISFENGLKLQSGSTFNLNDIIKNTPNSGETIAFQIIDFEIAEDNILTGVEKEGYTRTLTVTEKLVTLETVKDGDKTVKTATEIILDKITPKLIGIGSDKAEIVLKKLGSLPMENIESIKLGNTQTTADRNDQDQTFTLKNINLTNGGNLELRVKLKNPSNIKNNSDLRFRLDSFKNESDASTGFVEGKKDTNKLIFNNPKINVFGEGKENTGDITDQTFNLGKLSINIDGTEKVTLKTLTLRQEGTTSYKDIKNLQLVEESSNYNATQKEGIFTFNFGENGKPISQNTTLIVKGELNSPIDNRTLRFTIDNYTLAEDIKDEEKEKTPNTTKSITYSSPVVTIAGNSGNVVSDAKENITLDKLKIETKNTSSTVIKTIKLEKIGNIGLTKVTIDGKDCTFTTEQKEFTCEINNSYQNKELPLNITIDPETNNGSTVQFKITKFETAEKVEGKIIEPLTNKLTFNKPFVRLKGEPAKEVEIHSTIFTGGQIGISYDGVDEIKIESVTVELSGINAKDIKQLDLVKDNTTVTTTNPTDSKITFQIPEGIKLSQGKSPMEFTINGELVKPLADNAKFSFKVVDITAADKDNTQITDTKIDTPDSTRTWVYKASLVKLGVKNKEDFTTGTRKNLALDIFTGELQNVTEANIQDIVLTPQGSAKDKIESINVGGTPFSKQNDGSYKAEKNVYFNETAKYTLTITFTEEPENNSELFFEISIPSTTQEGYPTALGNGNETTKVTFNNPKITLKGDGKGTPAEKTEKSEVNFGNLTFTMNGLPSATVKEIILTLSGKDFKAENLTSLKLTTEGGELQMNGSLEGNTAKFTSKDTNGVNISNGQTFVVKATLTGEIADNAEFYFEVKDFTINEPASKQSENTTKSIKFINPTIFLKGIQSQSEKIVGDSYAVNVIEIALQKVQDPKLFTIILEKEEGLATGNIDSIILAGITGEYLAENQYKFDFGTTGLQINDSDKLSLTLNFTGTDEELKEKKIGFSIKEATGNKGVKITIEPTKALDIMHGTANNESCWQGEITKGHFEKFGTGNDGNHLRWEQFTGVLKPDDTITLKFTVSFEGVVPEGATGRDNTAWGYVEDVTASGSVRVQKETGPSCQISPNSTTTINLTEATSGSVTVTCSTNNQKQVDKITIDCGNGITVTENNKNSLTKECKYEKKDQDFNTDTEEITKTITCTIEGKAVEQDTCKSEVTLKKIPPTLGFCGNGNIEGWESCDCKNPEIDDNGNKICDNNTNYKDKDQNKNKNQYRCKNCNVYTTGSNREVENVSSPVACWDINNGSISINEGEILPFYWNIERIETNYYKVLSGNKNAKEVYTKLAGNTCNTGGEILLNSMLCTFKIYNGNYKDSESNRLYKFQLPCFLTGENGNKTYKSAFNVEDDPFLSGWIYRNTGNFIKDGNAGGRNTFASFTADNTSYKFKPGITYITGFGLEGFGEENFPNPNLVRNALKDDGTDESKMVGSTGTYGEYKLALDKVDYLECIGKTDDDDGNFSGEWTKMSPYRRVCEVNFTLTKPYLVTKTPSGIGSNEKNLLSKFRGIDGQTFAENLNNIVETNGTYNDFESGKTSGKFQEFIDKYQKLAKRVNISDNNDIEVSKVPGKEIYFVSGAMNISGAATTTDQSKTVVTEMQSKEITTPITIVQLNGDTTIKGNTYHNMMILSNEKIIFDGSATLNTTQTVNGIFYASGGFARTGVKKNDNVENTGRYIGGGLHINGALIGSGIDDLVTGSRSNLNTRFYGNTPAPKERKNLIYSGAGVLIEYSSSITDKSKGTMPPGAEDFTQSLSIYKR